MYKAKHFTTNDDCSVTCNLCPHYCNIAIGQKGLCRSKENIDGVLYATNYGQTIALSSDPIEKKPLYHFHPGTSILSLGPNSCNFQCFFCQNYSISQQDCLTESILPQALLDYMLRHDLMQIAFTYTEPLTWYEYIWDFTQLSAEYGIEIVLVTNGFINQVPLLQILPYITAMNIDLKSIRGEFYQVYCKGTLEPVINTIMAVHAAGVHLELTNLLIPGLNDSTEDVTDLVNFVADQSTDIPLLFSAYHPAYKANIARTSKDTVLAACNIAKTKLRYVYAGNLGSTEFSDTYCPQCGSVLIARNRHLDTSSISRDGMCNHCCSHIYGIYED